MHYIKSPEDVTLELGIIELLQLSEISKRPVFIVANHSEISQEKIRLPKCYF